jgi:hypothetical protein
MDEIRILYRTIRVIILQVGFILFAAIGVSLLIFVSYKDPIVITISVVFILLSFMGPIALLKKLNGIPVLIINKEGIYSENHKVIIRWNEVESFTFESDKWTENLVLKVSNHEKIIARSRGLK